MYKVGFILSTNRFSSPQGLRQCFHWWYSNLKKKDRGMFRRNPYFILGWPLQFTGVTVVPGCTLDSFGGDFGKKFILGPQTKVELLQVGPWHPSF